MSSELRKILHHLGKSGFLKSGERVKKADSPNYENMAIPNKAQSVPRHVPISGSERNVRIPPRASKQQKFELDPVGQVARDQGQKTAPFANFIYNLMTLAGTKPTWDNGGVDAAAWNNTAIPLKEPLSEGYAGKSPAFLDQASKRTAQQGEDFVNVEHVGDWANTAAGNSDTHPAANFVAPVLLTMGPGGAVNIAKNTVRGALTPSQYVPMFGRGVGMAAAYNGGKNAPSTLGGITSGEMGFGDALWNMSQGMPGTHLGSLLYEGQVASNPGRFMLENPEAWNSMSPAERQRMLNGGPGVGDFAQAAVNEIVPPMLFGLAGGPRAGYTPPRSNVSGRSNLRTAPRNGFIRVPISGSGQYGGAETGRQLDIIRQYNPDAPPPPYLPSRGADVTPENAAAMNSYLVQYGPTAESNYQAATGHASGVRWDFSAGGGQPAPQSAAPHPAPQSVDPNASTRLTVDEYANIMRTMQQGGQAPGSSASNTPATNEPSPQQRVADFWRNVAANPKVSHYDAAVELMTDPATKPIFKEQWPGEGSYLRPFWYWSMPKAGGPGAFDRVMSHNMSVDQHPYLHGAGDAALWTVGTGGPLLGTALMLGGLGGGGGSAGEYQSTDNSSEIDESTQETDGGNAGNDIAGTGVSYSVRTNPINVGTWTLPTGGFGNSQNGAQSDILSRIFGNSNQEPADVQPDVGKSDEEVVNEF